jgi:hypothetical protein
MVPAHAPRPARAACVLGVALGCCSCVLHARPVAVPDEDGPAAVLASGPLLQPLGAIARHTWFALREGKDEGWERWEVWTPDWGDCWGYVCRRRLEALSWGDGSVLVHAVVRGAEALRIIRCIRSGSPRYPNRGFYAPWPGPNSNTFVDVMLRECRWKADLPATAIGKDYRGFFGASLTSGGTGFQIETPAVGLKVGATEGLEIHLLAFTIGFDFWPFALKVPGGIGRIGWEDR